MLCVAAACRKPPSFGPPGGKASSATHCDIHRLDGYEDVVLKLCAVAVCRNENSASDAVDASDVTDAVGASESTDAADATDATDAAADAADAADAVAAAAAAATSTAASSATTPADAVHRLDLAEPSDTECEHLWMPDEMPLPCSDKTGVAASTMSLLNRVRISTSSVFI